MLQWRLPLSLLVSLGIILSASGKPAPPPMKYTPVPTEHGTIHSWKAWEYGDFPEPSLGAYVQTAHQEMYSQLGLIPERILSHQIPRTMASLLVKEKGIMSTSDVGGFSQNFGLKPNLHPKTQALFSQINARPNRSNGYCCCIQAINSFYEKFPEDRPEGCTMAIYGNRGADGHRGDKFGLKKPCRGTNGIGCTHLLRTAGITSYWDFLHPGPKHLASSKVASLDRPSVPNSRATYGPSVRSDTPVPSHFAASSLPANQAKVRMSPGWGWDPPAKRRYED